MREFCEREVGYKRIELLRWDGWMAFLCELSYRRLVPSWLSKEIGDIHPVTIKNRVDMSSCLTPLSCKPLDRCMWQRLSINPTSCNTLI